MNGFVFLFGKCCLGLTALFLFSPCMAQNKRDEAMRSEADVFLKSMPVGLQEKQADAISMAMHGNSAALEEVRHSRTPTITLSSQVDTLRVKGHLLLFRPKVVKTGERLPLLIYFHGGGWTFGSINSCSRFCNAVAASGKVSVLAVDYPLAPEHPFPEAVDMAADVMATVVAHAAEWGIDPARVSMGGDSSGGNIAIAAALQLAGKSSRSLCSLLLFYPVTKAFADESESWMRYGKGYALDSRLMDAFFAAYLGNNGVEAYSNGLLSPGMAPDNMLAMLPPTLLVAAERDVLNNQGRDFVSRLQKVGVKAQRVELPGTVHLFITVPGQTTAFKEATKITVDFLNKRW